MGHKIETFGLTARSVESYLGNRGWVMEGQIKDLARIWRLQDEDAAEILVPLNRSARDYDARLYDAILKLAAYEVRTVETLVREIAEDGLGYLAIRVIGEDVREGTIPIRDGSDLILGARELFSAALHSVVASRRVHRGKLSDDLRGYVDSLRLGQTSVGSFVVKIHSPREYHEEDMAESRIDSIALRSLVSTLEAAETALDRYEESNDISEFEYAVDDGLSANFCDALVRMSGSERRRDIELSVNFDASSLFQEQRRTFFFGAVDLSTIDRASAHLKETRFFQGVEVTGYVSALKRGDGHEIGTVKMTCMWEDQLRSITARLSPDDYHIAAVANDSSRFVTCKGDLALSVGSAQMLNISSFDLLPGQSSLDLPAVVPVQMG